MRRKQHNRAAFTCLAAAAALAWGAAQGFSPEAGGKEVNAAVRLGSDDGAALPPLDLDLPERTETATFALG